MIIALYVVSFYLLVIGMLLTTSNFRSFVVLKAFPFFSGLVVLFEALTQSGFILNV